jgi:hypothetical protein
MGYIRSLVQQIRERVAAGSSTVSSQKTPALTLTLSRIDYSTLNARQKENYNFLKLSALRADYGFMTMRLSDDWQGADFIAQHIDGNTYIKVQLKGRPAFGKKYLGKDLYIAFFSEDGEWYLYPHDQVLKSVLETTGIGATVSWTERGGYSFPTLTLQLRELLEPYKIGSVSREID